MRDERRDLRLERLDARMVRLADAAQRQARPRGRLDPGEVVDRPRPADELDVDVVIGIEGADLVVLGPVRNLAAKAVHEEIGVGNEASARPLGITNDIS